MSRLDVSCVSCVCLVLCPTLIRYPTSSYGVADQSLFVSGVSLFLVDTHARGPTCSQATLVWRVGLGSDPSGVGGPSAALVLSCLVLSSFFLF